jgi:hypothetical protein
MWLVCRLTALAVGLLLALPASAQSTARWTPFEPVQRPPVPEIRNPQSTIHNPLDAFLAAEHDRRGLKPRPEAPRHVLLRRVYLDLIGLPPTREELHAFLADPSPDAFENVVERLLASPHYGERWGRHWMDVWRYSDWAGYGNEVRDSMMHIWRWRDWIVEALNTDKGYDHMVLEMLAGDELAPDDPDTLRATGFLARNWYKFNRNVWLQNTVEHTAKAFLGVTINCARCHDHFFDDIKQPEYYAFRAFFEPHDVRTDRVPGQPDLTKDGLPRAYDARAEAPTFVFVRGEEHKSDKSKPIPPAVPALLGGPNLLIEPVKLPVAAYLPDKREFVIQETLAASKANIVKAQQAVEAARRTVATALAQALVDEPLRAALRLRGAEKALDALVLAELDLPLADWRDAALISSIQAERLEDAGKKDWQEWKTAAIAAGWAQRKATMLEARRNLLTAKQNLRVAPDKQKTDALKKVADAEKALATAEANADVVSTVYTKRPMTTYPATSTGRRLALARWIVDRQNPLAARVAMNHLWLRHFGKALVPTVFDFGRNGQPPSHPALLDWLAVEFMERGWSMKQMHRLIVTSSAYRRDSANDANNASLDPDNRSVWRMNVRRLEAELVRDSVLHVAGQLDRTLGGPDLDHKLGLTSRRRSLYFRHAHEKQMEFLYLFDAANVTECYQRNESVAPQQALALANSSLVLVQSRLLARDLSKRADSAAAFVKLGFEQVLGRQPTAQEQAECERFLREQAALLGDPKKLTAFTAGPPSMVAPSADPQLRARENLIHVLMNHNEFVTIR